MCYCRYAISDAGGIGAPTHYKLVKITFRPICILVLLFNQPLLTIINTKKVIIMKKKKTIYHLVVDKSGSMGNVVLQTISGYNEQVQQIRNVQKEFPEQLITIGLTTFTEEVNHHYFGVPASNAESLNTDTYRPDGSTALFDAIGASAKQLERQQLQDSEMFDMAVVIIILTDGEENSSRNFRLEDIKRMIRRLEETGKWTFSFIGASLDAVTVATSMNIKAQNSMSFAKETMQQDVWDKVSSSVRTYASKRRRGDQHIDLYTSDHEDTSDKKQGS